MKWATWIMALSALVTMVIFGYSVKLFGKPEIVVEGDNELSIDHNWGSIELYQYFNFKNIGNKQGSISKIQGLLRRKDDKSIVYKFSTSYIQESPDYSPVIDVTFNSLDILSGDVVLTNNESLESRKKISSYTNYIYNYLDTILNGRPNPVIGVREKDFFEIRNFIASRIKILKEGEYEYIIRISSSYQKEPIFEQSYNFVIFETDIDQLIQEIENYRKGQYIYFNDHTTINSRSGITTQLTKIDDPQIISSLKKALDN